MFLLPNEHRQIARLFDFLLQGEQLAFDCASAQMHLFEDRASRNFLRNQARQEKYHYRVFKSGIGILAPKGISGTPGKQEMQAYRQLLEAARASGDWLLFLHADTWLPEGALQAIANLDVDIVAGGFRQQFSRPHWFLALVSRLHNWRCSRTRVIYGDQALFMRRDLFTQIGGFPDRFELEDVLISERILAFTRPVLMPQTVITSSRKFEQRGPYRCFFDIVVIMCCYELRLPVLRRAFFSEFR